MPLKLIDGILCSTESTTNPDVALLLTYQLKSNFINSDNNKTAWPVLVGVANQVKVLAVGVPVAKPNKIQPQKAASPSRFPNLEDFKAGIKRVFSP